MIVFPVFSFKKECLVSFLGNDKKVYEFIVRHFLACCSKDAQGHETVVDIDVNGEKVIKSIKKQQLECLNVAIIM